MALQHRRPIPPGLLIERCRYLWWFMPDSIPDGISRIGLVNRQSRKFQPRDDWIIRIPYTRFFDHLDFVTCPLGSVSAHGRLLTIRPTRTGRAARSWRAVAARVRPLRGAVGLLRPGSWDRHRTDAWRPRLLSRRTPRLTA